MPDEKKDLPKRCELCDEEFLTSADRETHLRETNHCRCWMCDGYIPPGGTYAHLMTAHYHDSWNEHMAAWSDMKDLEQVRSRLKEDGEKTQDPPVNASEEGKPVEGEGEQDTRAWAENVFREAEKRPAGEDDAGKGDTDKDNVDEDGPKYG